ncbi:hypothetical protein OH686_11830 [Pseudomonas sp. SO81]|nr:hypothetical protein OH686_11830 [Pseudomonas sp. SO81]
MSQAEAGLPIGSRKHSPCLIHAQERFALRLANHAAGCPQVGGTQSCQGDAQVAEVGIIRRLEAGSQVLSSLFHVEGQLGQLQAWRHSLGLEGLAVRLRAAIGEAQLHGRLQEFATLQAECERATESGITITQSVSRKHALTGSDHLHFGQIATVV